MYCILINLFYKRSSFILNPPFKIKFAFLLNRKWQNLMERKSNVKFS